MDLGEFVTSISKNCNNWWMCAHLVDLIEKINPHLFPQALASVDRSVIFGISNICWIIFILIVDDTFVQSMVPSVRESFILQYASGFVSHSSLVMMALNYFSLCPIAGGPYITQIIDHLDMANDKFATMVCLFSFKGFFICQKVKCPIYRNKTAVSFRE